ncbi:MAG: hypothetical protein ACTSRG_22610 [Candidatus Helarchaeota archaeon]
MVQIDHSQMFKCPKCGQMGIAVVIKVAGNVTVVKLKCPAHGGKTLKLSTPQIGQYIGIFKDSIFRCLKCGRAANIDHMKVSGPWTLVRMSCEVHGNHLSYQKIWSSIYQQVSIAEPAVIRPHKGVTTHLPSGGQVKIIFEVPPFCPYCKAPLNANNIKWINQSSVTCPYCETTVPCNERKI